MSEIKISNDRNITIRKLKTGDVAKLADCKNKEEEFLMTLHIATKMPVDEIRDLELQDLALINAEFTKENPGIVTKKDF